jgi:ectoine hydroxylase-related dioxygenase (phytanoyl-CoA dioxygenase family)
LVATPSFAVTMIVPTVALSKVNGATRVVKGSHLKPRNEAETMPIQEVDVPKGSIFFMDYRLTHQGAANNSDAVRPILSYVYHRPWFRDFVNYRNQAPLNLTDATWTDIPKANHGLIVWVRQG